MANNTIMTAKNTFGDGMLLDFAPDNTQATCLTHALNATLVTMNGNEMSLQNDMGNGRVETAYLPEGYVPVGTCEFGGIVYIVSYNPLTNKSQIGCFPSPERNISSDEIQGIKTTFNLNNFIKYNSDFDFNEVVSNSIKKVIYQNDLNPGDKFIVHSGDLEDNKNLLSDYGNKDHIFGAFPKQYKVNVVAIEDSGKINYLNSDLKWYDNYYINAESTNNAGKPDIDSYRNILNSGYCVFQSKVSGKLAIMIELERVNGFSCTYEIYKNKSTDSNWQNYSIYANFNWQTDNFNVNPQQLVVYDVKWVSNYSEEKAGTYEINGTSYTVALPTTEKHSYINLDTINTTNVEYSDFLKNNYSTIASRYISYNKITPSRVSGVPKQEDNKSYYYLNLHHILTENGEVKMYDDTGKIIESDQYVEDYIVNNYFSSSISKKLFDISIPYKDSQGNTINQRDLILSYKVAPVMPYGVLTDLAQIQYIDFSKIGSGEITLDGYRYYNGENLCTLQLESSIYPEENKGVSGVELEFYDNQGLCAIYNIDNRVSYSGIITSYIPLNGNASNYKLSYYDSNSNLINHAGQIYSSENIAPEDTTISFVYLQTENNIPKPIKVTWDGEKFVDSNKTAVSVSSSTPIFYNDAGTLYSNMLYAVKIIYKYTIKNALGEYDSTVKNYYKTEWRWLWTNTMFNQYYYNVKDFKDNKFELQLDISTDYRSALNTNTELQEKSTITEEAEEYEKLGTYKQTVSGRISTSVHLGLQNTYNTFCLSYNTGANIKINVDIPKQDIISYTDKHYVSETQDDVSKYLEPTSGDKTPEGNIYDSKDNYSNFQDYLKVSHSLSYTSNTVSYIDSSQSLQENVESSCHTYSLSEILSPSTWASFKIELVNYNKFYRVFENKLISNVIQPLTRNYTFLQDLGLCLGSDSHFYFKNVYSIFPFAYEGTSEHYDKKTIICKYEVSEGSGNMDLNGLRNYKFMKDTCDNTNYFDGYYRSQNSGDAAYSQLNNTQVPWFMGGANDAQVDARNLNFHSGFFINLYSVLSYKMSLDVNNNENVSSYEGSAGWDYFGAYPKRGTSIDKILAQIGFYGDKNGCWHLFNDYFMLRGDITDANYDNGRGSSVSQFLYNADITVGDRLVEVLSHIYAQSNEEVSKYLNTSYIYYQYETNYTKDIVYTTKTIQNNNNILIQGTQYYKYLNDLKAQLSSNSLTDSNVTLEIQDISKNLPISINIPSKVHEDSGTYIDSDYINEIKSIKATSGLLQIKDNNIIPLNKDFQYIASKLAPKLDSTGSYLYLNPTYEGVKINNYLAYTVFNYENNNLTLKRYETAGVSEHYSWVCENVSRCSLRDLFKSECLIPGWQII